MRSRRAWTYGANTAQSSRSTGSKTETGSRGNASSTPRTAPKWTKAPSIAWPENFPPSCLSAIQHAMNLFLFKPLVFASEYQNSPLEIVAAGRHLTAADLQKRMSGRSRGIVPTWATKLTCGIDVQANLLFWLICRMGRRLFRLDHRLRHMAGPKRPQKLRSD
jgi:hypothetical protein